MEIGICKLCDENKELQNSHVIGKSVFKKLLKNSGKNFNYSPSLKEKKIKKTADQWATPMLCKSCEDWLNSKYENYSLWALKNKQSGVEHFESEKFYTIVNVDQYRLALYLISIYWRAAHSRHPAYSQVLIHDEQNEYLKKCILNQANLDFKQISVRISKLIDSSGQIGSDGLEGFVTSLHPRILHKYGYSYYMLFEGYYFEIFFNSLSVTERAEKGVVKKNKKILHLPYVDIFSIKELVSNMIQTREIYLATNPK